MRENGQSCTLLDLRPEDKRKVAKLIRQVLMRFVPGIRPRHMRGREGK